MRNIHTSNSSALCVIIWNWFLNLTFKDISRWWEKNYIFISWIGRSAFLLFGVEKRQSPRQRAAKFHLQIKFEFHLSKKKRETTTKYCVFIIWKRETLSKCQTSPISAEENNTKFSGGAAIVVVVEVIHNEWNLQFDEFISSYIFNKIYVPLEESKVWAREYMMGRRRRGRQKKTEKTWN